MNETRSVSIKESVQIRTISDHNAVTDISTRPGSAFRMESKDDPLIEPDTDITTDDIFDTTRDSTEQEGSRAEPYKFGQPDDNTIDDADLDELTEGIGRLEAYDLKSLASDNNHKGGKHSDSFDFVLEIEVEEAKPEESISEESRASTLDRMPYFEKFMEAMGDYGHIKRLNNFFHKKMGDYFRKRKMDHVLIEVDHPSEAIFKYGKKLDSYAALTIEDEVQRRLTTGEMSYLKEQKEKQCQQADDLFASLIEREIEVGTGLISTKTGKEIPEKYVEKLVINQCNKSRELRQLRLNHIKIRNAVTEQNREIHSLDKIGDNYTLIEFEQLKIENQGHIDKAEERDDELSRLRKKCTGAIQSLAHIREKCSSSEQNIRSMKAILREKEREKTVVREEMNRLKQERDYYRLETQRLKEENGLLTKDKLLIDMENAIATIAELEELNKQKRSNLLVEKEKLKILKKHYDREVRRRAFLDRMKRAEADSVGAKAIKKKSRRIKNKFNFDRPSAWHPQIHSFELI